MITIELIEFRSIIGAVFGPVPPAPIAPLRDQELFKGEFARLLRDVPRMVIGAPRGQKKLPSLIVFLGSDPYVEIRVDPGAGEDVIQRLCFEFGKGFGDSYGFQLRILRNAAIQFAQKGAP